MGDNYEATFSAIHRETEKLLRWKEANELMTREKLARVDHYKKVTEEQVCVHVVLCCRVHSFFLCL